MLALSTMRLLFISQLSRGHPKGDLSTMANSGDRSLTETLAGKLPETEGANPGQLIGK
jgi:hypothetical protein